MKLKMLTFSLMLALFLTSVPPTSAKQNSQTNDWNSLKNYLNSEVAVKTANQKTVYGVLREAGNEELKLLVVKKSYQNEVLLKRGEVERVWLAKLKFGRNTIKGAGIGALAGAGAGLGLVLANRDSGDGQIGIAVPVFAIYGAGIGAVIGFLVRKKHKKGEIIYQN
ncbi:MAG: hypothetical protein ABI954_07385 [Pyrinomonadaceae bacterium]